MKAKLKRFLLIYQFFRKIGKASTKNDKDYTWAIIAGGLFIGGPIFGLVTFFVFASYMYFQSLGATEIIPYMGISFTMISIFLLNILHVMSTYYFSENASHYLHLPIKPWEMLTARFAVHLKGAYLLELISLLPFLLVYTLNEFTPLLLLSSIIVYLLLPIGVLSGVSVLVMIIMKYSKLFKNKEFYKGFAGVIGIVFGIGFNVLLRRVNLSDVSAESAAQITEMVKAQYEWLGLLPDLRFASGMMAQTGWQALLNGIGFLATIVCYFGIFMLAGQKIYLQGALSLSETTRKTLKNPMAVLKSSHSQSANKSYIRYEIRKVFRNPQFLLTGVVLNLVWMIYFLIAPMLDDNSSGMLDAMSKVENQGLVLMIVLSVMGILLSSNILFYTGISRMGNQFEKEKYLPMSIIDILRNKAIATGIMGEMIGLIFLVFFIYLGLKPYTLVAFAIGYTTMIAFCSILGLILDLKKPRLEWESEKDLSNKNGTGFKLLLIQLPMIGAAWGIYLLLNHWIDFEWVSALISIGVIYGLACCLVYKKLLKKGETYYRQIR